MTLRTDVSAVPAQGGYVAKRCPVRAQNDVLMPGEPLPVSPVLQRRLDRGVEFEASVLAELMAQNPRVVVIEGADADAREAATIAAMTAGAPMIVNARLPIDPDGRRVGKPDLLIASPGGGYHAADIKHHRTLDDAAEGAAVPAWCSGFDVPWDAHPDSSVTRRRQPDDALQLAHYQRMLEAAGFAAQGSRRAAIIGTERRLVWIDLDQPMWRTPSSTDKTKLRSTMQIYDFEFDFRLDIIATAMRHRDDPSVGLLVVPIRTSECDDCPWRDVCAPVLEQGSGDVSLLPRVAWREWKAHHDNGVTDRAAVAALHAPTAALIAAGVDVATAMDAAADADPATSVDDLAAIARRPTQVEKLAAAGYATAGDIAALDRRTAAYTGMATLAQQIDQARAALGPAAVYRRRGLAAIHVPRADVEVDVDMENIEEGCYLWGALLTADRRSRYHSFVTWDPMDDQTETANTARFWAWLMSVRDQALAAGRTFAAYCYSEAAENRYLYRFARATGIEEQMTAFVRSDQWIDLYRIVRDGLVTGGGRGLKAIAPLAAFEWDVDDAGGGESMLRYDVAAGPAGPERDAAREWLLTYNRGDVQATRVLREWLATADIDPIETLDPSGEAG